MALLLGGLSLEQYAGVTTALAEGFALDAILTQEGIAFASWPDASRAWTEAIVDAPDLQIELIQKRRIAEDCLGREIAPLAEDPVAWTGLLGALAVTESPAMITEALGITMGDIARLGRQWKRKMEADPKLAEEVVKLAPTAKPPTRVEAKPRALRPFPWTPAVAKKSDARETVDVRDASKAIIAVIDAKAAPPRRELASFQLEQRDVPPGVVPAPIEPSTSSPQRSALSPAPLAASPPPAAPPAVLVIEGLPPAVSAQMTAWAPSSGPTGPATPFEALEPGAHGITLMRYTQLITLIQQPGVDASAVLAGFGLDEEKHRAIEDHYNKKFAREARWATEFGRLIAQAQRVMRERLAAESKPRGSGTSALPIPEAPHEARSASDDAGATRARVAHDPAATAPPGVAPLAEPGAQSITRPPRSRAPELTLEQYAWVMATLQKTSPDKLAEVLGRLRLTHETRAELDEAWRLRVASEPGLRAALSAAIAKHLAPAPLPASPASQPPPPAPPHPNGATPPQTSGTTPAAPPQPLQPERPRAPSKLAGTALASEDFPKGPATPFVQPPKPK